MEIVVVLFLAAVLGLALWLFAVIVRAAFSGLGAHSGNTERSDSSAEAEAEGNAHSGPYGYSGATAYPETQYGSGFDPDADWADEHEQ